MKNNKLVDIIIVLGLLLAVGVGIITIKHYRETASKQIEAISNIDFKVFLRGVTLSCDEIPMKKDDTTFISIRNVPYTDLKILDVKATPKMVTVSSSSNSGYRVVPDATQPDTFDVTVTVTDKAKITKDGADLKVASDPEITAGSLSQANVQITTDTTFSGSVSDSKGANAANSVAVKFTRRSYYDVVAHDAVIDSAQKIEALGKNQLTGSKGLTYNNLTANNQKIVYAYPASFGNLTSIKDGNGFDNLASGWTKTTVQRGGVDYNVYTLNDPMSITGGKLTFA